MSGDLVEMDLDARVREWRRQRDQEYESLKKAARASYHAMETWSGVGTPEQWQEQVTQARERYETGAFLVERLGAERFLDADLMATLLLLHKRLVAETGGSAAELMAADLALLAYYHSWRVSGWVGNLALLVEHEFFGADGPGAKLKERHGYQVEGLHVEDVVRRLGEQLFPLLERANRMMLRNLALLREYRRAPAVSIGSAGQVNVAEKQVNVAAASRGAGAA